MAPARVVLVQYGCFRDALLRRSAGEPETFRMQYYTLGVYERIAARGRFLVINLDTEPHEAQAGGFEMIGGRFDPRSRGARYHLDAWRAGRALIALAERFAATHVAIATPGWPLRALGAWAIRRGRHLLPFLADYVASDTLVKRATNRALCRVLNHPAVAVVANHHYGASRSLAAAGVRADKIVPWDYPPLRDREPRADRGFAAGRPLRLVYAGALVEAKGVGDLLEALAQVVAAGARVALTLCGEGEDGARMRARARALGLDGIARFSGIVSNREVRERMRDADLVVVPSRRSYPEGLAGVISEAFEVGTPLLVADHPAFALRDGAGCRRFRAGDPRSLAALLAELLADPQCHRRLVETLDEGWRELACPVTFAQVWEEWMRWTETGERMPCLAQSLASLPPESRPASRRTPRTGVPGSAA
jgi:glycosyltransferase involved in cell wall biosynthesis